MLTSKGVSIMKAKPTKIVKLPAELLEVLGAVGQY
jgi:hypothetical protein